MDRPIVHCFCAKYLHKLGKNWKKEKLIRLCKSVFLSWRANSWKIAHFCKLHFATLRLIFLDLVSSQKKKSLWTDSCGHHSVVCVPKFLLDSMTKNTWIEHYQVMYNLFTFISIVQMDNKDLTLKQSHIKHPHRDPVPNINCSAKLSLLGLGFVLSTV